MVDMIDTNNDREHYDRLYQAQPAFKESRWLYGPLIRTILRAVDRPPGEVIDAGCGQGQFTSLLADAGLPVLGMDISSQGIVSAAREHPDCRFQTGDVLALPPHSCSMIFTRSLSLYNTPSFPSDRTITDRLLNSVVAGGVLVWLYNVKPGRQYRDSRWRHHTLSDVRAHFQEYPSARVAFSLRIDAWLPRWIFWSRMWSAIAYGTARLLHLGGELIVVVSDSGVPSLLVRREITALDHAQSVAPVAATDATAKGLSPRREL
jgi:SAM-dependent methyltransferase